MKIHDSQSPADAAPARRLGPRRLGRSVALAHGPATLRRTKTYAAEKLRTINKTLQDLDEIAHHCPADSPCAGLSQSLRLTGTQLREHIPDELPFLTNVHGAPGRLRVAAAMREWLLSSPHPRRKEHLRSFLVGYQEVFPLCLAEVRLLSLGLQLAVLDKCRLLPSVEKSPHRELLPRLVGDLLRTCQFISRIDWDKLGEEISHVHQLLERDPAHSYPQLDFVTRGKYLQSVEQLSRLTRTGETVTAGQAVALAEREKTPVGEFLLGPGKGSLVRELTQLHAAHGAPPHV